MNLRIFENPDNRKGWDKSVVDLGLEVLCVSQVGGMSERWLRKTCVLSVSFVAVHTLPCDEGKQARLP